MNTEMKANFGDRQSRYVFRLNQWICLLLIAASFTAANAADYVIVVDTSGSMRERISGSDNRIRITVVQNALREYLPALPQPARVCLIAFNTGIVSERELRLNDPPALQDAMSWVAGLDRLTRSDGQTHLWTTLRRAFEVATRYSQENPSQLVIVRVLTDGQDNQGVTSLEKVLSNFPFVDGEHIRGNLVLLGDFELKTKLTVPKDAFTTTKSITWADLFPPVVLSLPQQPVVGDQVRVFENTKAIYKDYEWSVDGAVVSREKVLTCQFGKPGLHRVTLKVTGLDGTKNATTVLIRATEQDKPDVDFVMIPDVAEPQQDIRFVARCGSQAARLAWQVNSNMVATNQDFTFRFADEGQYAVKLTAWNAAGTSGDRSHIVDVREKSLAVSIRGAKEVMAGRTVQLASEITGPCASVEWDFGDGKTSGEKNPQHTFDCGAIDFRDYQVRFRAVTQLGKVVQAAPHTVRVWAEKKVQAPRAAFRVLNPLPKAGDVLQLVDDSQGLVDAWAWEVVGEATSHERSPAIRVATPGDKTIRLEVKGPGGTDSVTNSLIVTPRYASVKAKFSTTPQAGEAPLKVQMRGGISGDFVSVRWAFGDGQFSTNAFPSHTFLQASNYTVTLVVYPTDPAQTPVESRLIVNVRKPVPAWAKALALVGCIGLLAGIPLLLARKRQKKALRLSVYFWPEDVSVCRSVLLTCADEARELTPDAPIRIKRVAKSTALVVEPINGAVLLSHGGEELATQNIGQGSRILVRGESTPIRAIAISVLQKPQRPTPAPSDSDPFQEKAEPALRTHDDNSAWEWEGKDAPKTY